MEQNMTTIPFDLETAKRIANGEQEGSIVTVGKKFKVELVYHIDTGVYQNLGVIHTDHGIVSDWFSSNGCGAKNYRLELEVPEYMTFKDGDIIAYDTCSTIAIIKGNFYKNDSDDICSATYVTLIDHIHLQHFSVIMAGARLVTEEEKQKLIDALKASQEPKAKEYLKRFFGIEEKPEYEFKSFDKVLVKDNEDEEWHISFFAREIVDDSDGLPYKYECSNGTLWNYCIPFEGNETLLGTNKNPEV
jgi:hypothetical protein